MNINSASAVLGQLDGQWQKIAALILWKTVGPGAVVNISQGDIELAQAHFEAEGGLVVFTHGRIDSFDVSLISMDRVRVISQGTTPPLKGSA